MIIFGTTIMNEAMKTGGALGGAAFLAIVLVMIWKMCGKDIMMALATLRSATDGAIRASEQAGKAAGRTEKAAEKIEETLKKMDDLLREHRRRTRGGD